MDNHFVWKKVNPSKYDLVKKNQLSQDDEYELYNEKDNFSIYNLSKLKIINIPTIMNVLCQRYDKDDIYTYNGKVLVSINPFKMISQLYDNIDNIDIDIPHIYSVAESAYRNLYRKNQAILVSGESGSGKTENTKFILKYLSKNYGLDDTISNGIIRCNHLIECFGNAKTIKNNNSSRFGKFIKLFTNDNNKIIGANIENYLLEKSRITSYNNLEKSYHVFYFYNSPLLEKYNFSDTYKLISVTDDLEIDEFSSPSLLIEILNDFDFDESEIDRIFYTIKLILELSNVHDRSSMDNILSKISQDLEYLETDKAELMYKFTKKVFVIGNEEIEKNLEFSDTEVVIKSFCEDIYSELFDFIIDKVNDKLGSLSDRYISILDIFGFEIFKKNGYEQLCINYTNEILQNIYNKNVLENEQIEYEKEGIDWNYIEYNSNKEILSLFHSRMSLFGIINEQSILSSGKDKNIYANINKHLSNNNIITIGKKDVAYSRFSVNHYAGNVVYTVDNYILKNRIKSKNRKIKTNLQLFVNQLNKLEKQLDNCNCMFVRCIKPNDQNIANAFDYEKIHDQLLYSGVIEGIKLVLKGYPVKIKIDSLCSEFKYIYGSNIDINQILDKNNIEENRYSFGKSKIFMKRDVYDLLSDEDYNIQNKLAIKITNIIKTWFYRKKFIKIRNNAIIIQSIYRMYVKKRQFNIYRTNKRAIIIQKYWRAFIAHKAYNKKLKAIQLIQNSIRIYLAKIELRALIKINNRKISAANTIKRYFIAYTLYKKAKQEKDVQFQNEQLREELAIKNKESTFKTEQLTLELNKKDKELEYLKQQLKNQKSNEPVVNLHTDSEIENKYKEELNKKDRELEELKRKLFEKNTGNNLKDSINENYIMNTPDENGLYEIDLNSKYDCDNAVELVGKKLENMYLELSTRDEMMDKLSARYKKLEKLYQMEKKKKAVNKTFWQKIADLF